MRLCAAHGAWLDELTTRFKLVWATAWGTEANRLLAPLLHLPALPGISFPSVPFSPADKLPPVISHTRHRRVAWIDDALPPEAHQWAARRRIPTLLIGADPAEGLHRPIIDRCLRWAENHTAGPPA